ncbi:THO complex subunit 1 [Tanacetum coccineum]
MGCLIQSKEPQPLNQAKSYTAVFSRLQEAILTIPRGITTLVDMLMLREIAVNNKDKKETYATKEKRPCERIEVSLKIEMFFDIMFKEHTLGQLSSQRAMPMPTQDLFCKRTMAPQVCWMSSGQAGPDGSFPKRLGVKLSRRDSPQADRRLMSPMGTNVKATSTAESANISSTEAYVRCDTTKFRKRIEDLLYCSFSIQIAHDIFSPDDLSLLDSYVPSLVATGGTEAETKAKSSDAEGDEDIYDADEIDYFSNPASIGPTTTKWHKFPSCLTVVLNTFKAQPLNDEDGAANNLEDEAVTFSIKYLTSSNLMGLEF